MSGDEGNGYGDEESGSGDEGNGTDEMRMISTNDGVSDYDFACDCVVSESAADCAANESGNVFAGSDCAETRISTRFCWLL